MRWDPLTGEWTIYAPERGERPGAPGPGVGESASRADCPFCPGNEEALPEILYERPSPDPPGWSVRAVSNRYPVVRPGAENPQPKARGPYAVAAAIGRHEVIVESPHHELDLPDLSEAEMEAVLEVYRARSAAAERAGLRPVLFRNRGRSAGASQAHPHAQLVGMALDPPLPADVDARARRHRERTGRCLLCDIADHERSEFRRILFDRDGLLAVVPYAAHPFEVWLLPPHEERWDAPSREGASALAAGLSTALRALRDRAGDPDYNLVVHVPRPARPGERPTGGGRSKDGLHWHVRIRPRLLTPAGLELAAGVAVSSIVPEEAARILMGN